MAALVLESVDGTGIRRGFFGEHQFDGITGLLGSEYGGDTLAGACFGEVVDFQGVAIAGFDRWREGLALVGTDFEGGVGSEIEDDGGFFENDGEGHLEAVAVGHDPAPFGGDGGAVVVKVLGDDVIMVVAGTVDGLAEDGLGHAE